MSENREIFINNSNQNNNETVNFLVSEKTTINSTTALIDESIKPIVMARALSRNIRVDYLFRFTSNFGLTGAV